MDSFRRQEFSERYFRIDGQPFLIMKTKKDTLPIESRVIRGLSVRPFLSWNSLRCIDEKMYGSTAAIRPALSLSLGYHVSAIALRIPPHTRGSFSSLNLHTSTWTSLFQEGMEDLRSESKRSSVYWKTSAIRFLRVNSSPPRNPLIRRAPSFLFPPNRSR